MTWIILIAAILIGFLWWQSRVNNQQNTNASPSVNNNKDKVYYHQTHLATEASEELTPHQAISSTSSKEEIQQKLDQQLQDASSQLNQVAQEVRQLQEQEPNKK